MAACAWVIKVWASGVEGAELPPQAVNASIQVKKAGSVILSRECNAAWGLCIGTSSCVCCA
jgi:hypothetical protein